VLVSNINRDVHLNLSMDLYMYRRADEIKQAEELEYKLVGLLVGASNASRLGAAFKERAETGIICSATPNWRLTSESAIELAGRAGLMKEGEVLILYGLDSTCFLDVELDMRSGPPKKGKDGRYHLRGTLTVVTGLQLDQMMQNLETILRHCGNRQVVIVTPMPRFWIPCCHKHTRGKAANVEADRSRQLRELSRFRRTVLNLIYKLRLTKSVHMLNPLDALGAGENIAEIENLMLDQVHVLGACYGMLAEKILKLTAEWSSNKRRRERGGEPDSKIARTSSSRGGRGRGGRGLHWRGGMSSRGHW
jgi:hypothetical protein